jgi:hypothetical protein
VLIWPRLQFALRAGLFDFLSNLWLSCEHVKQNRMLAHKASIYKYSPGEYDFSDEM